jgi:hypothetical protein
MREFASRQSARHNHRENAGGKIRLSDSPSLSANRKIGADFKPCEPQKRSAARLSEKLLHTFSLAKLCIQ